MAYIITEPCIDTKDRACVDVCPVDCIYDAEPHIDQPENMLFIHPDECIDCAACEPVCPVDAIFEESAVPEDQELFTLLNYDYAEEFDENRDTCDTNCGC